VTAPTYLPRSWWADDDWKRGGAHLVDDELWRLGNVCHYPGRIRAFEIMTLSNLRHNLRGWYNYHVNTRGWADIGYGMCVSMTTEGAVVVDLRGIGRVPAAHASSTNPRANWHGGATLWTIGNTEPIHPEMVDAYRHFRRNVWLKRWPTATGVTHHRRVPGAQTGCAGDNMNSLVVSGALTRPPTEPPPPPPPPPLDLLRKATDMILVKQAGTDPTRIWLLTGTSRRHVADFAAFTQLKAAGVPFDESAEVSSQLLQWFPQAEGTLAEVRSVYPAP
jgi:hypothetical protein